MNIQQYITINNTSKIQIASKGSFRKSIIHSMYYILLQITVDNAIQYFTDGAYLEEIHVDIN